MAPRMVNAVTPVSRFPLLYDDISVEQGMTFQLLNLRVLELSAWLSSYHRRPANIY